MAKPNYLDQSKRLKTIISILTKYGLADWLSDYKESWVSRIILSKKNKSLTQYSREVRIRMAILELGPTFIKLGQIISTRPDLISHQLMRELEQLQSNTPADNQEYIIQTIEQELNTRITDTFLEFNPTPIASASIGQAHCATLLDGTEVIVKVKHQGIDHTIQEDLAIMKSLAQIAQRSKVLRVYQPLKIIESFAKTLSAELDFSKELSNLKRFIKHFKSKPDIHFPLPYPKLSSPKVLTMEKLIGTPLTQMREHPIPEDKAQAFVKKGANMYLDMIFQHGFYHADPHPGNLFYLHHGIVGVLDAGMVGKLSNRDRYIIQDMMLALAQGHTEQLIDLLAQIGAIPTSVDRPALIQSLEEMTDDGLQTDLSDLDMQTMLLQFSSILRQYAIILPSQYALLIKVLLQIDGLINSLTKQFSLSDIIRPYFTRLLIQRYNPRYILKQARIRVHDWTTLIERFPRELNQIVQDIRKGQLTGILEIKGLEQFINRLVIGIISSCLSLGSTSLITHRIGPLLYDISILGLIGYTFATILALFVFQDILQSKRKKK